MPCRPHGVVHSAVLTNWNISKPRNSRIPPSVRISMDPSWRSSQPSSRRSSISDDISERSAGYRSQQSYYDPATRWEMDSYHRDYDDESPSRSYRYGQRRPTSAAAQIIRRQLYRGSSLGSKNSSPRKEKEGGLKDGTGPAGDTEYSKLKDAVTLTATVSVVLLAGTGEFDPTQSCGNHCGSRSTPVTLSKWRFRCDNGLYFDQLDACSAHAWFVLLWINGANCGTRQKPEFHAIMIRSWPVSDSLRPTEPDWTTGRQTQSRCH